MTSLNRLHTHTCRYGRSLFWKKKKVRDFPVRMSKSPIWPNINEPLKLNKLKKLITKGEYLLMRTPMSTPLALPKSTSSKLIQPLINSGKLPTNPFGEVSKLFQLLTISNPQFNSSVLDSLRGF